MEEMFPEEKLQCNIEEFSRLQVYMSLVEKDTEAYKVMKRRYIELKLVLSHMGIDLTQLDVIKE